MDSLTLSAPTRQLEIFNDYLPRHLRGPLASGNLSVLAEDRHRVMITAKGHKLGTRALPWSVVDCSTLETLNGITPSTELPLHLVIYSLKPAEVVAHLHSPWVTAAACTLQVGSMPFVHYHQVMLGSEAVPVVPYATPGSKDLADNLDFAVRTRPVHAALLANHGCMVWGKSVREVTDRAEVLEDTCRICVLVGPRYQSLPQSAYDDLNWMFLQYGS